VSVGSAAAGIAGGWRNGASGVRAMEGAAATGEGMGAAAAGAAIGTAAGTGMDTAAGAGVADAIGRVGGNAGNSTRVATAACVGAGCSGVGYGTAEAEVAPATSSGPVSSSGNADDAKAD